MFIDIAKLSALVSTWRLAGSRRLRFRAAASSDFAAVKRLQHEINPRNGADAAAADDFQAILDHPGTTIWLAEADAPIACAT
ncbi:MAG: hypothetical protein AAFP78_16225, partial [Pseudomonadota bacterium]